jgi:hypothetical protein
MGIMHGQKAVDASHEPSLALALALDPGGESKSRSMIKSKTTRFMGMMHARKTVGASHEPLTNPSPQPSPIGWERVPDRAGEGPRGRFKGIMHGQKTVDASHEPVDGWNRSLDPFRVWLS